MGSAAKAAISSASISDAEAVVVSVCPVAESAGAGSPLGASLAPVVVDAAGLTVSAICFALAFRAEPADFAGSGIALPFATNVGATEDDCAGAESDGTSVLLFDFLSATAALAGTVLDVSAGTRESALAVFDRFGPAGQSGVAG